MFTWLTFSLTGLKLPYSIYITLHFICMLCLFPRRNGLRTSFVKDGFQTLYDISVLKA